MRSRLLLGGRVVAAVLVLIGGYIHLKLYFDGYRDVPDANLGRSFLLNAAAAVVVAAALVNATLIGFGMSRTSRGIFDFTESGFQPSPEAAISLVVEIAAAVVLIALLYLELSAPAPWRQPALT